MLRDLYERKDFGLLYLLAGVIVFSFVLGWLGIRGTETFLLRKEALEVALRWNRALAENLEDVEQLLTTGQHSEHDRPLFQLATQAGGIIRHKVYNSEATVVAASSSEDIGKVSSKAHLWDTIRAGQSHVMVTKPIGKNDLPIIVAEAVVPFMTNGVFLGAFEVYVDVTSRAAHVREIGNFTIGGLFFVLAAISGVGGILIFHDIDYRRRQREALSKAKEEAESANRAKSEFLASMSHEIRTPLNAINGFSEIIAGEHFGPIGTAKYQEYAQDIHDSGHLLLALINDILDMSKAEAGKIELHEEVVSVTEIVERGVLLLKGRATENGVKLSIQIDNDLPSIYGDERLLLQVLLNFLSNAVKFTPPEGKVVIRASVSGDGGLMLSVEDTGSGIAPQDIPKVLEPFGQAGGSLSVTREGTGLGLPLAKKFIELHGGQLQLESKVGLGTTVSAYFPSERMVSNKSIIS